MSPGGAVTVDDDPVAPRIESGSIVFGSDWPGLFLRGDQAFAYALHLEHVLDALNEDEAITISVHVVRSLLQDLRSVDVRNSDVPRQQLRAARECLAETPTIPGPPCPELDSEIDLDPDVEITID